MNAGQIVYSFFIVNNGLLELDSLFISEFLNETIDYARSTTSKFLMDNNSVKKEEYSTNEGYALIVKSRFGIPAHAFQETIWSYHFEVTSKGNLS